jgi:endonuclease/exonuclease/phosphatase family metal-dependent hydrolase
MRLTKNRKFLAIFVCYIILSVVSMAFLYIIVNTPDNLPPIINIENPDEEETLSGTITINFTAIDQQWIITEKQIFIDSEIVQTSAYSYIWDTTQELNGPHTILCRAKDLTLWGYEEINVVVNNSKSIDKTPPNVIITSPTADSDVSGIISIKMEAYDDNGISSYAIYIDGIYRSGTKAFSWDTTQETDGSHTIKCEAFDPSGNNGSNIISVNVNNSIIVPEPSEILKLMTFNIKESGEDPAYPDWKEVVKEENADIIIFIETGNWDDNNNAKLNQYLNEFNTYFTEEDPYIGYSTQGISWSTDGVAIMSRYPVISYNQITHVFLDNSTSYDVTHDLFDVELNVADTYFHVIGSHLKAMSGSSNEQIRECEQEGIINYMDNLGNIPIVYLGDLNSFSPEDWSLNTIQSGLGYGPLSMMIPPYTSPETGEDYSTYSSTIHNWIDVHRTLNPTDWGITYPSYDSRIDFIYVNQYFSDWIVNSTTGDTDHASTGSDHFTVDVFMNLS